MIKLDYIYLYIVCYYRNKRFQPTSLNKEQQPRKCHVERLLKYIQIYLKYERAVLTM